MRNEYGHCFCGTIVAEMSGEPFWICYDHDDDCRHVEAWLLDGIPTREVRFQKGHPKGFSKTRGVTRYFCGDPFVVMDDGLPRVEAYTRPRDPVFGVAAIDESE